ncbi:alpha/beta hydrolase [Gilvimarinus polysaccharolyticus]|uniref:alpha/beta hydrolase n=1 Tax=Gilvimarinus polysaccharolyticus TaxID=863921 RepID=UPI0006736A4B|nr:alpha/beta fold hydrolase [Gilvimarinus polysaccharolyticus]
MRRDVFECDQPLRLNGPAGVLEVAISAAKPAGVMAAMRAVAVVCHPHPLHGGNMDNKVVSTLMRAYRDLGVAVVRFNFRGVGGSGGDYAEGVGEVDDLLAVVAEVHRLRPAAPLFLAGFSFGAAVIANACAGVKPVKHLMLVAPPVPRYALGDIKTMAMPVSILQGGLDEQVVAADVARWADALEGVVGYREFATTGHFFHGALGPLKQAVTDIITGLKVVGLSNG